LVVKVFERDDFWIKKTETAVRVRARIEEVFDWAEVRGYRPEGVNPASWRKLSMLLPKCRKLKQVKHHTAMPYSAVAEFMLVLSQQETISARALEFTILTAARAGEACGAQWSEIDLDSKLWIIPAHRMKMRRTHRVPLPGSIF
jgi:integrase